MRVYAATSSRVTASHSNSEVKLDRDEVVLSSGRGWEGSLLHIFCFRCISFAFGSLLHMFCFSSKRKSRCSICFAFDHAHASVSVQSCRREPSHAALHGRRRMCGPRGASGRPEATMQAAATAAKRAAPNNPTRRYAIQYCMPHDIPR